MTQYGLRGSENKVVCLVKSCTRRRVGKGDRGGGVDESGSVLEISFRFRLEQPPSWF